jgi:hypothetical protein
LFDVQIENIDIITAAMGNALATDGGFCTGSVRVVDHQVCTLIKEKEKNRKGTVHIQLNLLLDVFFQLKPW